ncbi:MAG: BACON domain-containing protein [Bacteroidales bacterium]|nr:BACON domain-containing protein [Bacteroidales bacterium]
MKHLGRHILLALTAIALAAVACTGVRHHIDDPRQQHTDQEDNQPGINAAAIQAIEEAVRDGDFLTSFCPVSENGVITGYELVFEKAGKVKLETANADDTQVTAVTEDAAKVIFTFEDGTTLVIPKYQALALSLEGDDTTISAGESITVRYIVTGAANVEISVLCGDGWTAVTTPADGVQPEGQITGIITLTAPDPITDDKVMVFASDAAGRTVAMEMRLQIDTGTPPDDPPSVQTTILLPVLNTVQVTRDGGEYTVDLYANTDYTVETDADWLQFVETRAMRTDHLVFHADRNTTRRRNATATITAGKYSTQIVFEQASGVRNINIYPDELHFLAEGGTANVYIITNTEITIAGGGDWCAMAKVEGENDLYLVRAVPNAGTEGRTAVFTISGEYVQDKTLTITQDGYVLPLPDPDPLPGLPTLVSHIMPCCRPNNAGTKFLVNGSWNAAHDYGNIIHVRGILDKIRKAGINTVCIDFTNASQWDDFGESALHNGDGGEFWYQFGPMLENIVQVCNETGMEFCLFIGNPQTPWTKLAYWNDIAGKILQKWAKDPAYRHYGYGDDRPLLVMFVPGTNLASLLRSAPASQKNNLLQFHIGTCEINTPITPTTTDGWGYRNYSQSSDGKVRFACPNGGIPPQDWYRVDAQEWQRRVNWVLGATEYAVIGSYDDTCDAIFWGVADVKGSLRDYHKNSSTVDDPYTYYNIVRKSVTGLD